MGLFSRFFKKKALIELRDPVFGLITYNRGLWTFLPTKPEDDFMIGVEAPETGPTMRQRNFLSQLRSELAEYERRAREYMTTRVQPPVRVS